jgi:hypothetical protein
MVGKSSPAKVGWSLADTGFPQAEQNRLLLERLLPHEAHFAMPRSWTWEKPHGDDSCARWQETTRASHRLLSLYCSGNDVSGNQFNLPSEVLVGFGIVSSRKTHDHVEIGNDSDLLPTVSSGEVVAKHTIAYL